MTVFHVIAMALILVGLAITARTERQREIVQVGLVITAAALVAIADVHR